MACMHNASMKSQSQYQSYDCDGVKDSITIHKERDVCRRRIWNTSTRTHYDSTITLTIITITILLCLSPANALNGGKCPRQCHCTGDSIAFCNNNGYTSFPNEFSSTVQKLYLFNNNISKIPRESMRKLTNLTLLDISGNRISNYALWGGVFSRLTHLENLMLQDNQITKITANMFKGLKKLARIYLQNNQISSIESGAFDNLPSLVELKLKNNRITSFPKLQGTPQLLLLDLSHNRLRTIRDMALSTVNVEQLLLQDNELTQLRTSIFDDTSRLRHLDISDNRLTAVPQIIKSLTSLQMLNMSLNKVSKIPGDTFLKLTRLKTLDLHEMSLTTLPNGVIPPGLILNVFDIGGNKWNCGCGLSWLPQYISIFEEAFIEPNNIKCSAPSSKLQNRKIKDLVQDDFECTDDELPGTLLPPLDKPKTTTVKTKPSPPNNGVNPCDVYICFNGGNCYLEGYHPRCECTKEWAGQQCMRSLTTSTTSTTTTTTRTTTKKSLISPPLVVNKDSITETSVEIILPQTNIELLVSVSEMGNKDQMKELRIRPSVHPFTVQGLEAGKVYNICIHSLLPSFVNNKDSLCAEVKTEGEITVINSPTDNKVIEDQPKENEKPTENIKDEKDVEQPVKDGDGESQKGGPGESVTTTANDDDFHILYPALGAGLGAVIIVVMLVLFFVCYRQKRMMKLKKQNNDSLYLPGSPVDPAQAGLSDIELTTVVHHHHHNHYTAGTTNANGVAKDGKKPTNVEPKKQTEQGSLLNNNGHPRRVSTPNKTSSLGRSSNSSSSNCGTLQNRFGDSPQHYGPPSHPQHYYPPGQAPHPQYDAMHQTVPINGRANEYIYRNHQNNNNSVLPMASNPCLPPGRTYDPEMLEQMQPLVNGMNQYHYEPTDAHMYPDSYPMTPINGPQYLPQTGGLSYPQTSPRSAFQPIQSPRKNTVRTPTSDSAPITTHVNTAHVLPTSTCMNRNIVNDNITMYREGVPVA